MADPPSLLQNNTALVSTFSSLLTCAIHLILYERRIYPPTTFLSTRRYNYPVRQNRHPKVCSWITDAVTAVEEELLKGTVSRVAVVIYSPDGVPLERFVFDVSSFPVVESGETLTDFESQEDDGNVRVNAVDLEEQFRGVMRRLAFSGGGLGTLPEGCGFTVMIELKEEAEAPIGHPQPWIPSQPSLQRLTTASQDAPSSTTSAVTSSSMRLGSDLGGVKTTPVRAVEAGKFVLEMWIEEARGKAEILQGHPSLSDDPP